MPKEPVVTSVRLGVAVSVAIARHTNARQATAVTARRIVGPYLLGVVPGPPPARELLCASMVISPSPCGPVSGLCVRRRGCARSMPSIRQVDSWVSEALV